MNNGAVLWTAAMILVSILALAIAAEYNVVLAAIVWFLLSVILLAFRPE